MSLETDKERVTCLLLINTQLMKKAINIYTNLLTNKQILSQIPPQNKQTIMESYQNCTRRIHCNLSVLTYINEKYNSDGSQGANSVQQGRPQFPFIMSAPPDMPELNQLYSKLQELYPEALQFLKMKIQQLKKSQGQQGQQGSPLNSGLGAPNPAIGVASQGPGGAMPPSMTGAGLGGVGGLINQSPATQQFPPHQISHTPHHQQQFMVNSPAPSNVSGDASAFKSNNDFNGGGGGGFSGGNSSIYDPSMLMQQQQQQQQQQQYQQQQKSSISPQSILQMNQGNGNGGNGNSNGMLDLF